MSTTPRARSSSSSSPPADNGKPQAASLEELAAFRKGGYYNAPSGFTFRIRFLNLEKHALSGGLPPQLRAIATAGQTGVDELFGDDHALTEKGRAAQEWLDYIVRHVVVEPELPEHGDLDNFLIPADYRWLVNIGLGEETYDGEGQPLWGRERLSRFREDGSQ